LHYTNQLANEKFENDFFSNYEDKEMLNPIEVNEFEYEDFKEGLLSISTLDSRFVACSEGFRNDSWYIRNGYPKQDNEENVIMDTICLVEEIENESSYSFHFSSYFESLHEDEVGSDFKVYTKVLYDEGCDDEHPIFCPNDQRGSLHGIINPLFEEDLEGSGLVELHANGDTLSYCYNKSEYCSSICDVEFSNDIAFCELEDEVFDGNFFEEKPTLHSKFYDDSYEVKNNQNFNCEYLLGGCEVISNFDDNVMYEYKSDFSFEVQPTTFEEMQSQGMSNIYNSFDEVEYKAFVFPFDDVHELVSKDQLHFDVAVHEHVDVSFHSR
jgi:hypothetical protein